MAWICLLVCLGSLPVWAAQVQHLNTQTATASGAGAGGTPSIASFNIPSGKNRALFIWPALERDHCSNADTSGGLCTTGNTAGTGLGDNWPEPRIGTPPATTTNNQLTARVVGPGGTINKQNAIVIGGTPSGDTRFINIATSPTGSPAGTAFFSISSFHIVLFEDEIQTLLGGAASGTVTISLPDVSAPSNAGDDAMLVASVYQNVTQTPTGFVRNATATAQVTTGTPGNTTLAPAAYDAGQAPDEADDGKLVLGTNSSTEGFVLPAGHVALATLAVANAGGNYDTPNGNINNEPNGLTAGAYFRNGGATPGSLFSLQLGGTAATLTYGATSASFLIESDDADVGDAPISYRNPSHTLGGIRLGASVDADSSLLNGANATGDDTNNTDDEDGVNLSPLLPLGSTVTVPVSIQNASGFLNAWFDWNGDGDFDDAGEQMVTDQAVAVGTVNLSIAVPANASINPSYARFRVCTNNTALDRCSTPSNTVQSGEVEDYRFSIARALTLRKTTLGGAGGPFGFTLTNVLQTTGTVTTAVAGTPTVVDGNTADAGHTSFAIAAPTTAVTINESSLPSGWTLQGASCVNAAAANVGSLSGSTYTITGAEIAASASFTCTFTNAKQPILRLQKSLPAGRFAPSDQFALTIAGIGGPASVTTTGSGTTATGAATLNPGTSGASYTLSETGSGGADLANYTTTYSCSNALAGGQTPSGSGASFSVTAAVGDDLTCTMINTLNPLPNLVLLKTASAASFVVGVPASFTLQLSNTGAAATTAGATITDTIPAGLTIGTLPANCTAAGQTVTCTVATGLAASSSASFVIPVTPAAAAAVSVTNTATVSGGGDSGCPAAARCSSSVTVPVNRPQLTLLKTASAPSFTVGVPASFTLQLGNTGTAATTAAATITDTIPTGLTLGTLPAGCTAAGQTVTCTVAAGLPAASSDSFVIPVTATVATATSITNIASVSGGGDTTCPADARCTSSVTVSVTGTCATLGFPSYTLPDNAPATLAQAITCANFLAGADSIDMNGQTVTLTSSFADYTGATGLPSVSSELTLRNGTITRSGANLFRLLHVGSAGALALRDLTLTNGGGASYAANGGLVYASSGSALVIVGSTLSGGSTSGSLNGGALYSSGALTLANSAVRGNLSGRGGALAIQNGPVTISNSLISGNVATTTVADGGGAIYAVNLTGNPVTISNSTIAGNFSSATTAARSGGIAGDATNGADLRLRNTIVWGNTNANGSAPQIVNSASGASTSASNSLIQGGQFGALNADPLFQVPLAASATPATGGDFRLLSLSPAIDAGDNSFVPVDTLDVNGNSNVGEDAPDLGGLARRYDDAVVADTGLGSAPIVDIGAHERQTDSQPQADVSITKTDGQTSDTAGTSIQYTITVQNAGPNSAGTVTVADTLPVALTGATWTVAGSGGASCGSAGSGNISRTVSLPAGGSCVFTLNATIDIAASGTLSNTATASVGGGVTDPTPGNNSATDTTTIIPVPSASISVLPASVFEDGVTNLVYTVTLSSPAPAAISVNYTVSGSATNGIDFGTISSPLVLGVGASSGTITVNPTSDSTVEPDETVTLTLANGSGYVLGAQTAATGTIANDDLPSLSINDVTVTEGDSGTVLANFTVSLSHPAPAGGVGFNIATANGTASAGTDYVLQSLSGESIAAGNSSYSFSVAVNGDTLNEPTETFFVNVTNVSGATVADGQGVGTINNDDPLPTLSIADLSVVEGNSGTSAAVFTVTLNTASGRSVGVSYASANATASAGSDYAATSGSLTFSPGQTSRIFSVTINGDAQVEPDETFFIGLSGPSNATIADSQAVGTIQNDDTAGISIAESGGSTAVTEGGSSDTYTVVLTSQPTANVSIALSGSQVTPSPTPIVFTSANWNVAQTVTVTAIDDAIAEPTPHAGSIASSVSSGDSSYGGLSVPAISVAVSDNDSAGITVNPTTGLVTTEAGGSASFSVVLASQPTANVSIGLSSSDTSEGTVAPASLNFTPANWNVAQTVTVTGADDALDDGDIAYSVLTAAASSADPGYDGLDGSDVSISNTDNDTAGISVSPTSGLSTSEAGGTASFTVVLDTQPLANVSIGLSSSDNGEGTVAPASLSFTPANWNVAQTATITGVDDASVDGNVAYTIVTAAASSSDASYSGLNPADVAVSNNDDDTASVAIVESAGSTAVTEGGASDSYTLVLGSQPSANVSIALTGSQVTPSPTPVVFTPANWNVAQTVSVAAIDDAIDEPTPHAGSVSAVVSSSDADYNGVAVAPVVVAVTDNDTAGIQVSPTSGLVTTEAGGSADFSVVLSSQPTANVSIGLSSSDTSEGTVAPTSVSFTPANWNIAQTVTVTGVDDAIVDGNVGYSIVTAPASSSDSSYSGLDAANVSVSNSDNDTAGIQVTPTSGLVTTEAGGTASFSIVLASQPAANVSIGLSSSDTSEGTVAPAGLSFTPANWNVAQTVTVTGVDDALIDGNTAYSVITAPASSSDPVYDGLDPANVSVSNSDNDSASVLVSESGGSTAVTEGGASDSYTVVLGAQPGADVTITLNGGLQLTPSPGTLVYTSANWNTPQTVTVTAIDDPVDEPTPHAGSITTSVSSSDSNYAGLGVSPVSVAISDNDTAGIELTPTTGLVTTEAGGSASFSVVLSSQPTANVSIGLSSSDTSEGTVAPASLGFTPANWNIAQTVTVTGVDDAMVDGTIAYSVITAPAGSSDPSYDGLDAANVSLSNSDNDVAGVLVSETGGTTAVSEGGASDSYTLVLASQPSANVSIALSGTQVTPSPTPVVFTPANWNVAQTVSVTAIDDAVAEGTHSGSITSVVSSSDSNYGGLPLAAISVAITDNDSAGITLLQSGGDTAVSEGGASDSYTLVLTSQPSANVSIALAGTQVTPSPTPVVFTSANWNVAQTVTVTAIDDAMVEGAHSGSITSVVSSGDSNYAGLALAAISVAITDNDSAGITLLQSGGDTAVAEGGASDSYTLVLTSQPAANVSIALTGTQVTPAPTPLVFTSANWNVAQTVSVTAIDDAIAEGTHSGSITAVVSSSDGNYNGLPLAAVSVAISDNDTAGITLLQSGGNTAVTEGGASDSYTLVLTSQPSANVAIALAGTQVTPSPTPLVFTPANWNVAQTVSVTAIDDAVAEGTHSGSVSSVVSSSDSNYGGLAVAAISVAITDNDTAGITLLQSGGDTAVAEGGTSDSYTLVLTSQPTANVSFALTGTQVIPSPTPLVFTPANWNVAQTVTVTAIDDAVAEGTHSGSVSSVVSSSDSNYGGAAMAPVSVSIADNDNATISLVQSGGTTAVSEGGASDSYTLVLTSQPSANVSIALTGTQVTPSPTPLVFTPANWNVAQTVSVTAIDDAVAEGAHSGSITAVVSSSDSNYGGLLLAAISVAITDNDTAGITLLQSGGNTAVAEGGASDSYTLVLTSQPTANVSIALTGSQVTPSPTPLVFTSANWNVAQTVAVTAIDDGIAEGAHTGSVSASVSSGDGNYQALTVPTVSVSISDNDVAGVSVVQSGGNTAVAEGGASDTLTVVLTSQPTANVSIALTGSQVTPSPTPLVFTGANWNIPQTVTMTAIDDAIDEASPHAGQLGFALSSTDASYQGIPVAPVAIDVGDNDTAGITLVQSGGSTAATEGGASDSYTVVLASQPTANVVVVLAVGAQAQATPGTLTFTPANWNLAQTVSVSALDDTLVEGPHSATISHGVSSSDPAYSGLSLPPVTVDISDNDSAVVGFSPASVSQSEGTSPMLFTVTLSQPVQSGVTLTLNTANGTATTADYTAISAGTVSFPAGSNASQTVSVVINSDALDEDDETYSLVLSGLTATGSVSLGTASASGTIVDDDATPSLTITSPSQAEGNSGSAPMNFTASLSAVSGRTVSFTAATANGSATAPGDYVALAATPLSIPAGQSSLTIPVTINGDATFEGNEAFSLSLTGITHATPGTLTGTGTILEDDQQPTTTTITSDLPDPSVVGQPYTVAVTVAAQSSSPTGSVSISDGSASCTAALSATSAPNSSGSCTLTSTTAGAKTLTASYTASSSAYGNSSGTATHQVNAAATTISVAGPTRSRINQPTAFSFALAVSSPGAGTPSGTVTLSSGSASCTATLPATSCNLSFGALGSRTVTASYAGDGNYAASASSGAGNAQTLVYALSDIAVTKTDIATTFVPGDLLVYTVTVRNLGPDGAAQIRVTDNVPAGLLDVVWSCDASGGASCPVAGGNGDLGLTVGSFPVGGLLNLTFYGNTGTASAISNTALVELPADTSVEDPVPGNNSATDVNLYDLNFRDGFEDPQVNAASGSVSFPASALRGLLDSNAMEIYTLRDARGTALRLYARVHGDRSQYALALRNAQGRLRLGVWQTPDGDPQLSWTASKDTGDWVLNTASLR